MPKLGKDEVRFIQQVTGTFLYYAHARDPTIMIMLSASASEQVSPTDVTLERTKSFLDYVPAYPDTILTSKKSNIVLAVNTNASYLSKPKTRSRE